MPPLTVAPVAKSWATIYTPCKYPGGHIKAGVPTEAVRGTRGQLLAACPRRVPEPETRKASSDGTEAKNGRCGTGPEEGGLPGTVAEGPAALGSTSHREEPGPWSQERQSLAADSNSVVLGEDLNLSVPLFLGI